MRFVEQWVDFGRGIRDGRWLGLLTATGGQAAQRGQRQALKVATSQGAIGHLSTYFLGRPTAAEHRLQRLISVFILAPHLVQRRAFNCFTNLDRGRVRM